MDNYLFESIAVFERKKEIKQKGRKFLQKRKMFGLKKKLKKFLVKEGMGLHAQHAPPIPPPSPETLILKRRCPQNNCPSLRKVWIHYPPKNKSSELSLLKCYLFPWNIW